MSARSNVEAVSNLPKYEITPSKDFKGYLVVRCPREDCPSHTRIGVRPFVVFKPAFLKPRRTTIKTDVVLTGRSCPYCFKASSIS